MLLSWEVNPATEARLDVTEVELEVLDVLEVAAGAGAGVGTMDVVLDVLDVLEVAILLVSFQLRLNNLLVKLL
jgi:hypothetical protein